ncbi:type VII secretion protein EsaA [Vagococcus entomophilus]|uniref:Type VII secretion system accessory factor EsaA n=2 Tax=Vagococcus entomophilus TaxID=1160095 RepID=A0A430AL08_9ENTE|nr:type VII secretion protein EsaA [Vagococcus entomophilus]
MGEKIKMKSKIIQVTKIVVALILLTTLLIYLNNDYQKNIKETEVAKQNSKLNIALVNEDQGVHVQNQEFNLGLNYTKKIEKDSEHNWYIVSRGIAENGLKNGTYQLMITVPSNFSQKILDMNSVSPEKVQVNYKINSNGNTKLENESNTMGNKVVNDLNQQLVSMYVASILNNLYTAQQNIQKVSNNQNDNVNAYQNSVFQPATNFQTAFPALVDSSKGAIESNQSLTKSLTGFTGTVEQLIKSQASYDTTLEKFIAFRKEGKMTYEEFAKSLLEMDQDVLSQETQALYDKLVATGTQFDGQFGQKTSNDSFVNQMQGLEEQLKNNQQAIDQQKREIEDKIHNIVTLYQDQLFKYFLMDPAKVDKDTKITLDQVLKSRDPQSYAMFKKHISGIVKDQQVRQEGLQKKIDALPYLSESESGLTPDQRQSLQQVNDQKTDAVDAINNTLPSIIQTIQSDKNELHFPTEQNASLKKTLEEKIADLNENKQKLTAKQVAQLQNIVGLQDGSFTMSPDQQILIDLVSVQDKKGTQTYTNGEWLSAEGIKVDTPQNVTIQYHFASETALDTAVSTPTLNVTYHQEEQAEEATLPSTTETTSTSSTESTSSESTTESSTSAAPVKKQKALNWQSTQPVSIPLEGYAAYQKAKQAYSEIVGKIEAHYTELEQSLSAYNGYDKADYEYLTQELPNIDFRQHFENVLTNAMSDDLASQLEKIGELQKKSTEIMAQKESLNQRLLEVQENNTTLQASIKDQLNKLSDWRKNMTTIATGQSKVATVNEGTDSQLDSGKTTVQSLVEESKALKDASQANVEASDSVKTVFTSFDSQVKDAQENGQQLSKSANKVMNNFTDELQKNNDFVGSFVKVLNNAYKEGVSNDVLMQFIANPVNGKSEATVKSAEVYKPFTWVIVLFVTSLFLGFVFATQTIIAKVKDTFQKEELWFANNIMHTLLLIGSSVLLGGILAVMSMRELAIPSEQKVSWFTVILLFTVLFTLMNHYLIKQFKVVGFGISLFAFVSYIFLSSATGTTIDVKGMAKIVKAINPLSYSEQVLNTFFSSQALNTGGMAIVCVLIIGFILLNLFIWQPRQLKGVSES